MRTKQNPIRMSGMAILALCVFATTSAGNPALRTQQQRLRAGRTIQRTPDDGLDLLHHAGVSLDVRNHRAANAKVPGHRAPHAAMVLAQAFTVPAWRRFDGTLFRGTNAIAARGIPSGRAPPSTQRHA
jgi:hypothetical protein